MPAQASSNTMQVNGKALLANVTTAPTRLHHNINSQACLHALHRCVLYALLLVLLSDTFLCGPCPALPWPPQSFSDVRTNANSARWYLSPGHAIAGK